MVTKNTIKFFKYIDYIVRTRGANMPYPPFVLDNRLGPVSHSSPILIWEKINFREIKSGWRELVLDLASGRQRNDRVGLYIHIPFCVSKCFFCYSDSFVNTQKNIHNEYLHCLEKEIKLIDFNKEIKVKTVYIGGGTPSILDEENIFKLMRMIHKNFNLSECQQIMIEISPYTATLSKLKILKDFGVNKITIGVQTLDESLLKKMNRLQERRKVINIYRLARKVGIDYINIDLMSGLPRQTVNSFVQTLQEILMLKADTIHINSFWPISITPFARSGHQLTLTDLEKRKVMNKIGYQLISENCPYIIERDGLEKENIQIYNSSKFNSSLLGIGYGAFSHIRGRLHYIKKIDFNSYIKNLRHAIFPHVFGYRLNLKEEMRSNIIKAFEREGYVDKKVFYSLFNKDPLKIFKSEFEELLKFGRIEINGDIIQMTVRDRKEISIYSMFFYSPRVINKFKKIINLRNKEYQNIDLKRDYFYE